MSTQSSLRRATRTLPLAPCVLVSALMLAFPAAAQSNAALQKELRDLQQRLSELEAKLKAAEDAAKSAEASAKSADATAKAAAANKPQWGMTPEQTAEFNRISVKTEAMEDARDAAGLKGLKFSGYMDPSFVYNKNQKRLGAQFLNRVEDDGYNYDNSYFGGVALDLLKETDSGLRWRLTLSPNRGVGSVFDTNSIVQEATVSVPLGDLQTRFIAGQMPDWSGYEYLQPTLNKLTTHNLLFDFTLPTAYTGAGLDVTVGKLQSKLIVGNMNASKKAAGEKSPMFAFRGDYSASEYMGFGYAGVLGKAANLRAADDVNPITSEPYSTRESSVRLLEFDGYYTRSPLTLQGQISFGQQDKAAVTADPDTGELRTAKWWGFSVLAAYKFDPRLEGIARFDYIKNSANGGGLLTFGSADGRNGIGPGNIFDEASGTWVQDDPNKGGNRMALTVGMGYAVNANTTFKAEYRIDRSSVANFEVVKDGSFKKTNQLLATSVVVSF